MRTLPDGLTGAIMAIEGIPDAATFLHGPGGCRIRHMVLSSAVFPHDGRMGDDSAPYYYNDIVPYYFGYPRVPASYLDEYDFINGAYYKSEEGLGTIAMNGPSIIVIIDSPGAALIGDDHSRAIRENGLEDRVMHTDESLASMPAPVACGHTLRRVMDFLDPPRDVVRKGTVNLLGLSVLDKDWRAAREELVGLVESMGLEVLCTPGADSPVKDLIGSMEAEFNVVVCPEMCAGLSHWYESRGIPSIVSPAGAPVGFDALEAWIRTVAEVTGADPGPPLERIAKARRVVYDKFKGMRYNSMRIRGTTFSIAGIASVIRPLTEWLYSYLAMAPVAVAADEGSDPSESDMLGSFLGSKGFGDAWGREPVPCHMVLCEGITALSMKLSDQCLAGIPIGYSSMGLDDIIPRPVYGIAGAMYILDEILHGVRSI